MKIVQILPGKVWGGAEQYVIDLGRALAAAGHEVEYLCRDVEAVTSRLDSERIAYRTLTRVEPDMIDGRDIVAIHDSKFVGQTFAARKRCSRPPRIVFTRHIARASRVMPWSRKAWRGLDALIFVSHLAERMWRSVNAWMPAERCRVVHNSIPSHRAGKSVPSLRERFGIDPSTPILMFTGRVRYSKGCIFLINALEKIKDEPWAMVFVGAPKPANFNDVLALYAEKHGVGDRVHFVGFTPSARDLVAQADIGVQPSLVREAFGLSQLEFMQAGKPVITTDNGAQPEYIDNGVNGFLLPPRNADELAAAIFSLIQIPRLRKEIGRAAAEKYRTELAYPIFLEKILKVYTDCLNN